MKTYYIEIADDIYVGYRYEVHSKKGFTKDQLSCDMIACYHVAAENKQKALARLLYLFAIGKAEGNRYL